MPRLQDLFEYPLFAAIANRRSRRVARGTSVFSRGLSYESSHQPAPLSPLEEAALIVSTGLTGITTHDGPLDSLHHGRELGTPFLNILGRAGSSPDNSQPTHFVMVNDEGTCCSSDCRRSRVCCSDPDGQRPLFLDEWQTFRPRNAMDWVGWIASLDPQQHQDRPGDIHQLHRNDQHP